MWRTWWLAAAKYEWLSWVEPQQGFASIAHIPAPTASPRFDAAVKRHGLIDAIVRASTTGQKQRLD